MLYILKPAHVKPDPSSTRALHFSPDGRCTIRAPFTAKRRILEIVCLNWKLDGVSLVPEWRKPFDLLAEGLLTKDSRDGGI